MIDSATKIQVIAAIWVNLLVFALGCSMGWASSGMKFLESEQSDLTSKRVTPSDSGLINSLYSCGGLIGSLTYGFICNRFGRIIALRSAAFSLIAGFSFIAFANNSHHIMAARFFSGLGAGGLFISVPLFVSEISKDSIRGALGSLFILMTASGILFAFILGPIMRYDLCVWVYMLFPVVFLFGSRLVYETPYHLIKSARIMKAESSFMFYRGIKSFDPSAVAEFKQLSDYIKSGNDGVAVTFQDFMTKAAKKSIVIGIVIVAAEQFSGSYAIVFYLNSVFESCGSSSIAPDVATVIVGVIQLAGAYCSTVLLDRIGRKPLFLVSVFGISVGMLAFGVAIILIEHGANSSFIKLIPVIAMSFAIFIANIGLSTMKFVILGEISPPRIKSYVFTIVMSFAWVFMFSVFNLKSPMEDVIGLEGVMFFFSINAFLGGLFVLFYVPETKGKSLEEIARIMQGST